MTTRSTVQVAQNDQGETEMTYAQYELLNAALLVPGSVVVDSRGLAWNAGSRCNRVYQAAEKRGFVRLADPDAAGQRAVIVTALGKAAMRAWAKSRHPAP